MSKVLFVKGTPQSEEQSRSTQVARAFITEYKKVNPTDEIIEVDVYYANVPLIDADFLTGQKKLRSGEVLTDVESQKIEAVNAFTKQFMEADKYIIQSSMWNLGIQPLLKAYFDTIMSAGKTFKYTSEGPEGLMKGKKAIHIHGMGGFYSQAIGMEHSDSYVRGALKFVGIEVEPTIFVEGIDYDPTKEEEIVTSTIEKAKTVARTF
ncbi:FMN-dependent NADH-azoreductase [Bacillus altitudinis MN12]|nr:MULTISPECIES: NAD(P)H-dependent oxidoreductase [Bacillus]AHL71603.1 FMN-dependent NADH-azoreductase [Bacillus pumilus]KML05681.1 FMN-dependent NADH-azoreductase [Bacillus stratosphericus]UJM29397.1 NAD(P)H-dependent oxidoreductase [Bacillus aerophilus]CVM95967.1 Acyl carrier protein phosphodiesterase [Streptococcus pneumoniae]AKU32495.1 FMN-dependent NADH-azoreductase [Bacillus altitudinis]